MVIKRFISISLLLLLFIQGWAQAPGGYYDNAEGKKERNLKTALFTIIKDHVARSYANLWTDFQSTDKTASGTVWDMYSSVTKYTFVKNQCGNYSQEGDCYNREHSFPKSWFNDATPMYTDLFHLYPTDGYINGMRGNYPFGETDKPSKTSGGGFSKLGPCSFPGYSGTIFEPNDEYKGDFARTYFYMATCYEDKISSWNCEMLANNSYPAYTTWAINLLLKWNAQDPVSEKEVNRNNAVYKIQKNRNPFIDHPELAEYIWGDKKDQEFYPGGGSSVTPYPVYKTLDISTVPGRMTIIAEQATDVSVYTVLGVCVARIPALQGEVEISLPSGIYIVNGIKVVL